LLIIGPGAQLRDVCWTNQRLSTAYVKLNPAVQTNQQVVNGLQHMTWPSVVRCHKWTTTLEIPCQGSRSHMGRAISFIWLSTLPASAASSQTREKAPTRWPYLQQQTTHTATSRRHAHGNTVKHASVRSSCKLLPWTAACPRSEYHESSGDSWLASPDTWAKWLYQCRACTPAQAFNTPSDGSLTQPECRAAPALQRDLITGLHPSKLHAAWNVESIFSRKPVVTHRPMFFA